MKKIIAINGSTRKESSNGSLLNIFSKMLKQSDFSIYQSIDLLPHFNPDLEIPEVVLEFKRKITDSDYLLIVTPEYAHGIPGVLKNALDWLVSDENMPGKEVILFVCSTGDGKHAMNSLIEILKTMSLNILPERCIQASSIRSKFKNGELVDEKFRITLEQVIGSIAF